MKENSIIIMFIYLDKEIYIMHFTPFKKYPIVLHVIHEIRPASNVFSIHCLVDADWFASPPSPFPSLF